MGRPPCCDREEAGVKKGPWTPEEDLVLVSYVQEHGPGNWRAVPAKTGLMRCSKSCRLRWTNYLRPGIRRGGFSDQEDRLIAHLQALLGNRWAAIASYLPDRTDNDVKNYWNTHLKKRLRLLMQQQEQTTTPRDSSSPSTSTSLPPPSSSSDNKGKWELRLQTDIGLARRAQREALSVDAAARPCPPAPGTRSTTSPALLPGDEPVAATAPPYARNNISTMLDQDGWATPASGSSSELTADCSAAAPGSTSSASHWTTTVRQDDDVPLSAIESWLLGDDGGEQQLAAQEGILLDAALQFMA